MTQCKSLPLPPGLLRFAGISSRSFLPWRCLHCARLSRWSQTTEQWICRSLGRNRCYTPTAWFEKSLRKGPFYRIRRSNKGSEEPWDLRTWEDLTTLDLVRESSPAPREGWGQKLWALVQGTSNQWFPGKEGTVRMHPGHSSYPALPTLPVCPLVELSWKPEVTGVHWHSSLRSAFPRHRADGVHGGLDLKG